LDTETTTTFFALLAVLAQVAVVGALGLWVAGRFVPAAARLRSTLVTAIGPQAVALAAVVGLVCTLGSLYLSEVANYLPCRLCWYQRYAMYPQVVLLVPAAIIGRRGAVPGARAVSRRLRIAAGVLAAVGGLISIYHLAVERFPSLEGATSCDPANPCSLIWVEHFGYVTIPAMALSGFALIITLLVVASRSAQEAP
jgi:disulfide bond formation protein DsbB